MTYPTLEPGHFTMVKREGFDHIVKCTCDWEQRGYYHPRRAELAGQRHEQDAA